MPGELRGLDAYRAAWEDFLGWVTSFDLQELEAFEAEDVSFCHALVRCAGRTEPEPFPVRLTMGLRRLEGEWRIIHEHHSVAAPPS